MTISRTIPFLLFIFFFLLCIPSDVLAQGNPNELVEMSVEVGLDSYYKAEYWVPVKSTIRNDGPGLEGLLRVTVGNPNTDGEVVYTSAISLPSGSQKQQTFYIFLPGLTSDVTVELVNRAGETVKSETSRRLSILAREDLLYGVVSNQPEEFTTLEKYTGAKEGAAVAFLTVDDLPEVPTAWNTLDVLIFHNTDTGQLSTRQYESLRSWIDLGGQLVITGGLAWQETVSGLQELLPVKITGNESWDNMPELARKSGIPFRDPGKYLVTVSEVETGTIRLVEGSTPILVKMEMGRGSVFFLALDPALPPLVDWDGNELIWSDIADAVPSLPPWGLGATNGFSAANAVSSLPSLTLPSGLHLSLYLFLYTIIIGPINYLVLKRISRREFAWLTIPLLVIIFSGIAYIVGFNLKGNETIINQLSIVYGHVDGERVRVQSLLGLYSPRRSTYELKLHSEVSARPFSQSFRGLAGATNSGPIERNPDLRLTEIRVDAGDVATFVADSYQEKPGLEASIGLEIRDGQLQAVVDLKNDSEMTFENTTILLGTSAVQVGDIEPGTSTSKTISVASNLSASSDPVTGSRFTVSPPAVSPLAANYRLILGNEDFYNDRETYPRWQLLESLGNQLDRSTNRVFQTTSATLVAWAQVGQLDLVIENQPAENQNTTLYFLEVPISQIGLNSGNVLIPPEMIAQQVLSNSGAVSHGIEEFVIQQGGMEFEFTPWALFQETEIVNLDIVVQGDSATGVSESSTIELWNWSIGNWEAIDSFQWGKNTVPEISKYIGDANTIRLRLVNNSQEPLRIQEIYPEMTIFVSH